MSAIVTLCLSAGIQKTISFDRLKPGAVNRSRSYIYDAAGKAVNSARVLTQLMELEASLKLEDSSGSALKTEADNKAAGAYKTAAGGLASESGLDNKASVTFQTPGVSTSASCHNYKISFAYETADSSASASCGANKTSSAFKAAGDAPDDVTLICPLGKKNADFFMQLAARDGLNPEAVLIPGYTRECCTLLDDATGEVTELVVEEPAPEGDAPVSDLLFTLRTALARASAFSKLEDSGVVAFQAPSADKASDAFKAGGTSASGSAFDNKASVSSKTAGALPQTALLFAGSRPAFWPPEVITQIALAAKKAGALFMADFRGDDLLSLLTADSSEQALESRGADKSAGAFKASATGSADKPFSDNKSSVVFKAAGASALSDCGDNETVTAFQAAGMSASSVCNDNKASSSFKAVGAAPCLVPDIIKINEAEFRETFMRGQPADTVGKIDASVIQASETDALAKAIAEKSRELGNIIVVTRGADSTLAADCGTLYECASEKVHAINTIGCGDSFNAGFLYEYMASGDVKRALVKGTWCGARNAERLSPGTIR